MVHVNVADVRRTVELYNPLGQVLFQQKFLPESIYLQGIASSIHFLVSLGRKRLHLVLKRCLLQLHETKLTIKFLLLGKKVYICIYNKKEKMVLEYNSVYDEFAIFLANLSPRKILAYRSSAKAQERVKILLEKNKNDGLNEAESAEMERFMTIEHIVRLAKAKAMQKLNAAE